MDDNVVENEVVDESDVAQAGDPETPDLPADPDPATPGDEPADEPVDGDEDDDAGDDAADDDAADETGSDLEGSDVIDPAAAAPSEEEDDENTGD